MGKPVVATQTKAMKLFASHTYLADTPDQYIALTEKALLEDTPEKHAARIAFAKSHTWENCMQELYKAIEKHS
jgi:glycosyltransferase involved in cell wall biosynthesis